MPIPIIGMVAGAIARVAGAGAARAVGAGAMRAASVVGTTGARRAGSAVVHAMQTAANKQVARSATAAAAADPSREPLLDKLWKLDSAFAMFERIVSKLSSLSSTFIHSIQVSAVGGPNADLRRVWYLACAAAFGRYRNRIGRTTALDYQLEATWDVTGKAVMVSIGYTCNGGQTAAFDLGGLDAPRQGFTSVLGGGLRGDLLRATLGPDLVASGLRRGIVGGIDGARELIMRGPDQVTIGASWPAFLTSRSGADGGTLPGAGEYTAAGRSVATSGGEYIVVRFAGAQGPTAPDLFRELPYSGNSTSQRVRLVIPFGQVNDFTDLPAALRRYPGGRGPVAYLDDTKTSAPLLPDAGRLITTGEKFHPEVQAPRPAADGVSRYSLVELVTLALHAPCTASKPTLPADALTHGRGYFVPAATTGSTIGDLIALGVRAASGAVAATAPGTALDGVDNRVPDMEE